MLIKNVIGSAFVKTELVNSIQLTNALGYGISLEGIEGATKSILTTPYHSSFLSTITKMIACISEKKTK